MTRTVFMISFIGLLGFLSIQATQDDLSDSIQRGEQVYLTNCMSCHMMNGMGVAGVYPPLAGDSMVLKTDTLGISVVLNGQKGEVTVNGQKYNTDMPSQNYLTDEQIADVMNYVRNSWGNKAGIILPDQVNKMRSN